METTLKNDILIFDITLINVKFRGNTYKVRKRRKRRKGLGILENDDRQIISKAS